MPVATDPTPIGSLCYEAFRELAVGMTVNRRRVGQIHATTSPGQLLLKPAFHMAKSRTLTKDSL
jgi:hypothetical protein